MSTVCKHDGGIYTFSKGAPDFVIKTCSHYINKDNEKTPINDEFKNVLNENLESFAAMTLRTLLICYKEGGDNAVNENEAVSDLVILGMVGIKDPLREEIP